MADEYILVCLQDVLDAISDIESCFAGFPRRYDLFEKNIPLRCVIERKVEIMGEAINRIRKHNPDFSIPNARGVIDTRNRIIHAYDNVRPDFLWALYMRHIPLLKTDVEKIMTEMLSSR